jgi:hypothetical protein
MKRLAALLLLLPLLLGQSNTTQVVYSPAASFADILLWINFENCGGSPCTGTYTLHASNEYSAGDDTITLASGNPVDTTSALDGTYGLNCDMSVSALTGLDITSNDIFPATEGRVGMKFQRNGDMSGGPRVIGARNADATLKNRLQFGTNTAIAVQYDDNTVNLPTGNTSALTDVTELCVEWHWTTSTDSLHIVVDSVDEGVSWAGGMHADGITGHTILNLCNSISGDTGSVYLDMIIISNDASRDICQLISAYGNYPG